MFRRLLFTCQYGFAQKPPQPVDLLGRCHNFWAAWRKAFSQAKRHIWLAVAGLCLLIGWGLGSWFNGVLLHTYVKERPFQRVLKRGPITALFDKIPSIESFWILHLYLEAEYISAQWNLIYLIKPVVVGYLSLESDRQFGFRKEAAFPRRRPIYGIDGYPLDSGDHNR
jgi:hypothetical protein